MTQLPSDRAAHRAWLVGLTGELERGLVVDLGCGRGEDLRLLAARHGSAGVQFVGVDAAAAAIDAASATMKAEPRASLCCATLDGVQGHPNSRSS